jgi:hypothetical protein
MLAALYYHPEAYPPTLNAINILSGHFNKISIVFRPHLVGSWSFPENVSLKPSGKPMSSVEQEDSHTISKAIYFLNFCRDLYRESVKYRPSYLVIYDPYALLAYRWIRIFLRFRHKVWYHNHDVIEIEHQRKFSLGWFAARSEKSIFPALDIFSLPTLERLPYFDMDRFEGKFFYIPNYPSISFFGDFRKMNEPVNELRIIFQGRIGSGHGLEQIISLLDKKITGRKLILVLKGYCKPDYRISLESLAEAYGVSDSLEWHGYTVYKDVPLLASGCHVGVAVFMNRDVMNDTLGTSSNKVFEYAALGLPVLYVEGSSMQKILDGEDWAFPVTDDAVSYFRALEEIIADYGSYSESAHRSFLGRLNFEQHFNQIPQTLPL